MTLINSKQFKKPVSGSLTGSFSGELKSIENSQPHIMPIFGDDGKLTTGSIYSSGSFTAVNHFGPPEDPTNPEILYVSGDGVNTYNLISAHGNNNNYVQVNVQNYSNSTNASSDIVATADNGNSGSVYIDMGINSSGFTNTGNIGSQNDAYMYSFANDLYIGNASVNKKVVIFNGGFDTTANSRVYIHDQGTVGINTATYNSYNPPSLQVQALTGTYNVIQAYNNINNYSQVANTNRDGGTNASADFVAYNDIDPDNQLAGYIDMGINSTNYAPNAFYPGYGGDAYLFTDSHNLLLGTLNPTGSITLFAGGADSDVYDKLTLRYNNIHSLTGSLNVSGSITSSLQGTASYAINSNTASYALTASYASNVPLTASYSNNANTSSYALTASYVQNAISSSFAATASSADNFTVRGTLTAQTIVAQTVSSSIVYSSGSNRFGNDLTNTHQFTGSVGITGSLTVNNNLLITGSTTTSGAIARSSYINPTLIATANNDTLIGLDINPTFNVGAFTGVSPYALRVTGNANFGGTLYSIGLRSFGDNTISSTNTGGNLFFQIGSTNYLKLSGSNGNIMIQNGGTFIDNGYRLQVNGSGSASGSLFVSGSSLFSGSVTSTLGFTGSLSGSATNAVTASYAQTASYVATAQTASYVLNAVSASYAATSSFSNNFTATNLSLGSTPINVTTGYGNYVSYISYPITTVSDSGSFWIRVINISSNPQRIKLFVNASADNTFAQDEYEIVTSGYGMLNHILRKPTTYYNTSKVIGILTSNPTAASQEVWLNIAGTTVTDGTVSIYSNVALDSLANMQTSKTLTKPTKAGGGTELTIDNTKRTKFTLQLSSGAEFGGDVNITGSLITTGSSTLIGPPSSTLDVKGNQRITGSLNVLSGSVRIDASTPQLIISASANNRNITIDPGNGLIDATNANLFLNRNSPTNVILGNSGSNIGVRKTPTVSLDISGSTLITGSLTVTDSITGSLFGTAATASYILNAISSSYAATASYANNFNVDGILTAQTIVVQTISSSIEYASGSNKFGSLQSNTHQFTGSVLVTGSLNVTSGITGSLFGTASNANTASYVLQAVSASYAVNATGAFVQGGNSFGTLAVLGTNDSQSLSLEANNTGSLFISSSNKYVGVFRNLPFYQPNSPVFEVSGAVRALTYGSDSSGSFQSFGNSSFPVLYTARLDGTLPGVIVASGWGDFGINNSLLVGYTPNTASHGVGTVHISGGLSVGKIDNNSQLDVLGLGIITGSLIVTNTITGSLFGTASYASQSLSSSYWSGSIINAATASYVVIAQTASYVATASYSLVATSASYAVTSSYVLNAISASYATTSSYVLNAISSSFATTAQTAVNWSGSVTNAASASYVQNAQSASYWSGSIINAATASYVVTAQTASYVLNATSASFTSTASYVVTSQTASYVLNAVSSSFASTASYVLNAVSASRAISASRADLATTASYVLQAVSASYWSGSVTNAASSSYVLQAVSASYWSGSIVNAATASYVLNAISSSYALTASYAQNSIPPTIAQNSITAGQSLYLNFTGSGVTATVTSNTASIFIPGGGGSPSTGSSYAAFTQATPATTWTFNHNLGYLYPVVTVYDANSNQIIPSQVSASSVNQLVITFTSARTGYATAVIGSATPAPTTINVVTTTGANPLVSTVTGSYNAAFYNYVAVSASNARAGNMVAVWSGSSISFDETTTTDIGNTTGVTFTASLSAANTVLIAGTTSPNWSIKITSTYL